MRRLIFLSVLLFAIPAFAAPTTIKIPALKICKSFNGSLAVKQRCSKLETQMDASGITGQQGAVGTNGSFDPNRCVARESTATGFSVITATAPCLVDEVAVGMGCKSTSSTAYVRESYLLKGDGGSFPQLYGLARCAIEALDSFSHNVTAQVICCRP